MLFVVGAATAAADDDNDDANDDDEDDDACARSFSSSFAFLRNLPIGQTVEGPLLELSANTFVSSSFVLFLGSKEAAAMGNSD